mgnify:CR=1 FL=1
MKKIILLPFILTFSLCAAFTEADGSPYKAALTGMAEKMGAQLAENTTLLGSQPDAFVGRVFPAYPAHLAAGLTLSGAQLETEFIADSMQRIVDGIASEIPEDYAPSISLTIPKSIFLPAASISCRVGGFFLPFDIGLYGTATTDSLLKDISMSDFTADIAAYTLGGDLRYAVLEGGTIAPKVSVGAGYVYSHYSLGLFYNRELNSTEYESGILDTSLDLTAETHTMFVQAQVSKRIRIFTPFFALKLFGTLSKASFDWQFSTTNTIDDVKRTAADEVSDFSGVQVQLSGGAGIQLGLLQLGVTGSYNATKDRLGAALSIMYKM